jgi:hypothetical protein
MRLNVILNTPTPCSGGTSREDITGPAAARGQGINPCPTIWSGKQDVGRGLTPRPRDVIGSEGTTPLPFVIPTEREPFGLERAEGSGRGVIQ